MAVVLLGTVLAALFTFAWATDKVFGIAVTPHPVRDRPFANFAEAMAEARGRGQAASHRRAARPVGRRLDDTGQETRVPASELRAGDRVVVSAGEFVPADGEIVWRRHHQRGRGHRGIRAGAARGRHRPQRRDRRHQGALRTRSSCA